ncbi:WD-40 repeat protein, partial [Dunaliella salina]
VWDLRRIWDEDEDPCIAKLQGHGWGVESVIFSQDGATVLSGSRDKTIKIWDWRNSGNCLATLKGHKNDVSSVAVSPDGKTLASGSKDQTIRLWKLAQ